MIIIIILNSVQYILFTSRSNVDLVYKDLADCTLFPYLFVINAHLSFFSSRRPSRSSAEEILAGMDGERLTDWSLRRKWKDEER